jgi:hypothetical protein
MKEVRTFKNTIVLVCDEPGPGNACHHYEVSEVGGPKKPTSALWEVKFQNGPVKENGVNGVQNEDLLAIVIHRLQGFQSGPYACQENADALVKCQEALMRMEDRTVVRERRGVEGTSIK